MNRTKWKIAAVLVICLVAMVSLGYAQDPDVKGEVRFRYDWIGVDGDEGRFREDNWMTDRSTGGLDWLHLESKEPDENGYEWLLKARALYDYDYDVSFLAKKQDSHYLKLDFSNDRRYFDGSTEYSDPSKIHSNLSRRLAEKSDYDIFVDRRNYNIELGLTPPEGPQWIFGWHRLVKDGKERLLRGGYARGSSRFLGLPVISNQRLITDTLYGEVFWTAAEKYNFRIRQEWEQHRGEADIHSEYYRPGSAGYPRMNRQIYEPGYTNWRTMFMFDSFLDDETYVTANYMYNYLNNDSTYTKRYLDSLGVWHENDDFARGVGNSRRTNVGALGYRKANVMNIPALDFSAGVSVRDSKTDSGSSYESHGSTHSIISRLDEVRVAETVRLVYKGIDRTTLSFDADLEQRDLDWHARQTDTPNTGFDRDTDTDFTDQEYTLKVVHRHSNAMKSTVKFRIKDLERSSTQLYEPKPNDYPGWLGSYRRKGNDLTLKTDFRHNSKTSSILMYQYVQESTDFSLGGKTSNVEIHRGLGSVSIIPKGNLFLTGTFMLENYRLDTPATNEVTSYGPRQSDFNGTSYTLMLDGTYAFNSKTSCDFGFQHTEGLGNLKAENGAYVLDKLSLELDHKLSANRTIGVGYQFYKFDNQARGSGGFDDYTAHGMFATYTYTF